MADDGWHLPDDPSTEYTLTEIINPENREAFKNKIFYKERWYPTWVKDAATGMETKLEQHRIVSFPLKHLGYQRFTS